MQYWLLKSEPGAYSIDDLESEGTTMWDSIRNYQARNTMRDDMKVGDRVLFYHSNAAPPGVAGLATICSKPYPDPTQFDPAHKYADAKSDLENPRWILVDVAFERKFTEPVPLPDLRANPKLEGMPLLAKGSRLSVQPVDGKHFRVIVNMAERRAKPVPA